KTVERSGGDVVAIRAELERIFEEEIPEAEDGSGPPAASNGFRRVLQRAAIHVESSGKAELRGFNVVVAMFAEDDSLAVKALEENGVTRLDLVEYISHGVAKGEADDDDDDDAIVEGREAKPEKNPLEKFTV